MINFATRKICFNQSDSVQAKELEEKCFHTFYHNSRAHKVSGALEVEFNCVLYSGLNFVLVHRKNKRIKTIGIPGGCCTTVGPTGRVGRSIEYILCKLAEGLSSDPVGERTGLP